MLFKNIDGTTMWVDVHRVMSVIVYSDLDNDDCFRVEVSYVNGVAQTFRVEREAYSRVVRSVGEMLAAASGPDRL